jgi:hypothetical protein
MQRASPVRSLLLAKTAFRFSRLFTSRRDRNGRLHPRDGCTTEGPRKERGSLAGHFKPYPLIKAAVCGLAKKTSVGRYVPFPNKRGGPIQA